MKKLFIVLLFCGFMLNPLASFATHIYPYLYTPLIEWGMPSMSPNIVYTASTQTIAITGEVTHFFERTILAPDLVGGTVSIQGLLSKSCYTPTFAQGDFVTMGLSAPSYDLEVKDTKSLLAIGGNLKLMGINGFINSNVAVGGFIFKPLAGYLLPDFLAVGPYGGGLTLNFNIEPAFSNISFSNDFEGYAEGKIGATPEPGTLLLLGTGLLGFGVVSRLRRKKK